MVLMSVLVQRLSIIILNNVLIYRLFLNLGLKFNLKLYLYVFNIYINKIWIKLKRICLVCSYKDAIFKK